VCKFVVRELLPKFEGCERVEGLRGLVRGGVDEDGEEGEADGTESGRAC
jgi:hypothetical protein